ncbi:MAG: glycosyltransferase [Bacteroidales bacterium]|nr:glycosyltransferase [Bacteroidales bacterium]
MPNFTNKVIDRLRYEKYKFLVDHHPRPVIEKIWLREFGYKPDWKHPRDPNEKIQWLICYGDTSQWPFLADKYRVREYVKQKGYGHLLPKLYGVWDDADDIDFETLPRQFVLKCNHDCGSYTIIDKSLGYDKVLVVSTLRSHTKQKYGYFFCEPHYNNIKPLIIAEEFLVFNNSISFSQIDYKVWCFEGKPYCIFTCHNRNASQLSISVYDLDWNVHPEYINTSSHYKDGSGAIPRPKVLKEMLLAAEDLSQDLHEARIDFYVANDQLFFGEITLTSAAGRMNYFAKDYLIELGNQIHLPLLK